jgi:hypothetical protein
MGSDFVDFFVKTELGQSNKPNILTGEKNLQQAHLVGRNKPTKVCNPKYCGVGQGQWRMVFFFFSTCPHKVGGIRTSNLRFIRRGLQPIELPL